MDIIMTSTETRIPGCQSRHIAIEPTFWEENKLPS